MRCLITGGSGFIGNNLKRALVAEGVYVCSLVRKETKKNESSSLLKDKCIEVTHTDITVEQLCSLLVEHNIDIVFNLASSGVMQNDRDPLALLENNPVFFSKILIACHKVGVKRVIHAGSCSEYSPVASKELILETHPLLPSSLYSAAKVSATHYGAILANTFDLELVILRLFGVFGIGERESRLVPYIINQLLQGVPAKLTFGNQVRDFTYIDDISRAFILAAETDVDKTTSVFNVCSGRPTSIKEIALSVAEQMNVSQSLLEFGAMNYRKDEYMNIVGNNALFKDKTGWLPEVSLQDGILKMIQFYTKNKIVES